MTAIQEHDTFADAFGAFATSSATPSRRRPGLVAAVVVVALALLTFGVLTVRSQWAPAADPRVEPASVLPALGVAQTADDVLLAEDTDRLLLDPASTRYLASTGEGDLFAAVRRSGDVCLVTVPAGDLPWTSCTAPVAGLDHTVVDESGGPTLRLVASSEALTDGWSELAPHLYVAD